MPAHLPSHPPCAMDPAAAARWHARSVSVSPWLHEEVARRMQERLAWMVQAPATWCHWDPLRGGIEAHSLVAQRFPKATCYITETSGPPGQVQAQTLWERAWWMPWRKRLHFAAPPEGGMQMLWCNMALHMAAEPQRLLAHWHKALAVDGYVMFSCLGPDTLRELRALYAELGWPAPAHMFTDMHDWGDLLVQAGFSAPVMDMERITLTFATPTRLLQELRTLGRNLHTQRFAALRGRSWRARLEQALAQKLADAEHGGQLALSFEILYGHAIKAAPRMPMQAHSTVALQDMRQMLRAKSGYQ